MAELAERTFRDTFAELNTPSDIDLHCRSSYSEELQAREICDPNTTTLLCDNAGDLIAFGQLRWTNPPPCVVASRPAEIYRLYVDKAWHGKRVAQALMAALLETASTGRADVVWLGVWENNPRAIAFYTKTGFVEVGDHTFLLGHDAQRDLVLTKALGRQ